MLALLAALGSGPATYLGRGFTKSMRISLAPVLGLCLGTCVFTSTLWFSPARFTYWLLPPLAMASLTVALVRSRTHRAARRDESGRPASGRLQAVTRSGYLDAASLVLICLVISAPLNYTLHERHSVGPTGFEVWDSFAFTAEADAAVNDSIHAAEGELNRYGQNFAQQYYAGIAHFEQQLDAVPLSANVNELLGLGSTDTQTLFLIVFLISGGLGAFGAIRYAAPKPFWVASLGGMLFAGPFFLQLISDGSQPSTCGLTLILPILAVGADALKKPRLASLAVFALLISGLLALYPLFVPGIAITIAAILLFCAVRARRNGSLTGPELLRGGAAVGFVVVLSACLNLVAFTRDVQYWRTVLKGGWYLTGYPQYHLSISVVPGWLLQTREFYSLTGLGNASAKELLLGVLLPIVFIGVIAFGVKLSRAGLVLIALLAVYALMGYYESAAHKCSYCTDRALLPVAPVCIGLLAIGIAAIATRPGRWSRWMGAAIAVLLLAAVAQRTRIERVRFSDQGYFMEAANAALLQHLPQGKGSLDIEGYGQDPGKAPGEEEFVYLLGFERSHNHVSVPSEYTDYAGLAYLAGAKPTNPQFDPKYRYVLTRFGGLATGRRVIARSGSLALEERAGSLDATLVSGVAVPPVRLDAQGLAWVQGPLHFIVTGAPAGTAWVSLRFQASEPVSIPAQAGVQARILKGGAVVACAQAIGSSAIKRAAISLSFPLAPGATPNELFPIENPPQGLQLTAMRAVEKCVLPSA